MNHKRCLICKPKNDTLYFHQDPETKKIWMWCNKCNRGYSLKEYCYQAGISMKDFLAGDFQIIEAVSNEVTKQEWPRSFISLNDPRAKEGVDYLASRGLEPKGDIYYDLEDKGIVFPYYFSNTFVGAQIRFIQERVTKDGDPWKITTLSGTRLGLIIYGYNQSDVMPNVKAFIICEGAINALSLQQSLDSIYSGTVNNPFRVVACSGSGASKHHLEVFKELKDKGYKVIVAPDRDEAGLKMMDKYIGFDSASHYAITDTERDWNDCLKDLGKSNLAKYFLARVKLIER